MDTKKFDDIRREQFPLTEKCAYLDTATTGVVSINSRNAMIEFIEKIHDEGMDMNDFNENWNHADNLRNLVAELINADADEIFFSGSGSDMLNIFSNGIEIKENSNIVLSGLSFPSTPYTWMNRIGVENVRIAEPENGQIPAEKLFELVDEDTLAISLCLVENTTGFYHDIELISKFCQEHGIYLVLDITQSVGAMELDVKKTPVDFLVATTYKWLGGVFGFSFGYISKRIIDQVKPTYVGWTGNKNRTDHSRYKLDLSDGANRFETGSLNWIGLKGIEESINIYLKLGKRDVEEYILSLTDYLYEQIDGLKEVKIIGPFPKKNRSCISYIEFPEKWAIDDIILRNNKIRSHIANKNTMRISLHYYNNFEDIDKLIGFLKSYEE
ncbi:MAG: aminotransferase class V-fold PLP-dependent enzyme [Tissierellia bacterium]|nr:aminotransferase class V-fold PLP-dependent enzyme [Tissierellia bacterium]